MVISLRHWCLRAWVVPWASLATRDCACRRRLRPGGLFFGGGSLCGLATWFLGNVACNPLACMSRCEIGSLGLRRSWRCCTKFGRPNCRRLVGYEARGSNSCVRLSAQGCCLPYLGVRQACARQVCCVAGRGCGGARVGNQRRCSVRMVSDWGWRCWLGCGRKSPVMMGLWCVSWLVVWV